MMIIMIEVIPIQEFFDWEFFSYRSHLIFFGSYTILSMDYFFSKKKSSNYKVDKSFIIFIKTRETTFGIVSLTL